MDDRKTLAFIDGASLHKCAAEHGVTEIDAAVLLALLQTKTGSRNLAPPIITMLPYLASNPIGEAFRRRGFQVESSGTDGEEDDHLLCRKINAVDPTKIGRIVMVSRDHRYLRPLWELHKRGVSICWFIADSVDAKGCCSIGKTLRRFLTCGLFTWVDMKPFFPALRYTP